MKPIYFYKKNEPYGFMSNFFEAPFIVNGVLYKTSEHYFQSKKFVGDGYEIVVINAKNGYDAAALGRSREHPLRKDWEEVKDDIMYFAIREKFLQNPTIMRLLIDTGDAEIIEHTSNDSYWADGGDGSGKNVLGKLLMKLREKLTISTEY